MSLPGRQCLRVFISGTYDDLREFRERAARGIERAMHKAFDPHASPGFQQWLADKITRDLDNCDFYLGIYGTRYGSRVIDDDEESISYTEFEFDLAVKNWPGTLPPLLILRPHPRVGDADAEIRRLCRAAALTQYHGDVAAVERDHRRQEAFVDKVRRRPDPEVTRPPGYQRAFEQFSSISDLEDRVFISLQHFNGALLLHDNERLRQENARVHSEIEQLRREFAAVMAGRPAPVDAGTLVADSGDAPRSPAEEKLARLTTLIERCRAAADTQACPGMCAAVFSGQSRILATLAQRLTDMDAWDIDHDPELVTLTEEGVSADQLWRALWRASGSKPPYFERPDDADALAEAIVAAGRPSVVIVQGMQYFYPGLAGFATVIWKPLYEHLVRRAARDRTRLRDCPLYVVLLTRETMPHPRDAKVLNQPGQAEGHFEQIFIV